MTPASAPANPRGGRLAILALTIACLAALTGLSASPTGAAEPSATLPCPVEYGPGGTPAATIATDLPLKGASADRSAQMVEAVRLTLEQRGWKAGATTIGLASCDDSDAATGAWTSELCTRNANAYVADPMLLGVVGTYNSGCAGIIAPILNPGGIAMISPGNTLVCLTQTAASCAKDEPGKYFPSGKRNYARVVPNDAYQGAALATFAVKTLKAKRIAVLSGGDTTSNGQAAAVTGAAKSLGAKVVISRKWNPKATSYTALMKKVKAAKPQAILLAGLTEQHGGRLIKDKGAVLGKNTGKIKLLGLDGFAQTSTITLAGKAAAGMFTSTPGSAPELLTTTKGKDIVRQLKAKFPGKPIEPFAPYSAQAADVLLDAIAAHGTDRPAISASLYGTKVTDGVIGTFTIGETGDPSPGQVTLSVAGKAAFAALKLVAPSTKTVNAARGTS